MRALGLVRAGSLMDRAAQRLTFPSLVPVFAMDRIYTRGLTCRSTAVPRGTAWARMSDHLPLLAELQVA
jgi:endonuclease/exonuclease/phosphatase family metal-dependent hydrolase